jgi:hypothetical protein
MSFGIMPRCEEGMLQRICGLDPLLRVERQAGLQEIDKVVQVPGLRIVQAARCRRKSCA